MVRPEVFRRLFHAPIVEKLPAAPTDRMTMFSVRRVMLTPKGQVVETVETVGADGYYDIISRRVIVRDAIRVGLIYLPH